MGPHYKAVIIVHMSRLPYSHTFFFRPIPLDWHEFCRMRWFIPPTNKTVTSAAPQLCPGRTDSEEFNCLRISHLPVTDTVFGPMHQYIITKWINTRFGLSYTKTSIDKNISSWL